MERELRAAEKAAALLKGELTRTGQSVITFGDIVKANIVSDGIRMMGREFLDFGKNAVRAAIDFESAWAGVTKTVDGSETQMAALKKEIRDMALIVPASAVEIAAVAEAAGQLGIQTENIMSFTRTMIDLGESTDVAADTAAASLAQFANITKMSQADFSRLGSSVVELGNNYAIFESKIIAMGQNIAGSASQVGMSEAEIIGFATAISSVGIEAEKGGSAFSKTITEIDKAAAYGEDSVQQFAEVAGMSAKDFIALWGTDAAAAMARFIDGLGSVKDEGGNLNVLLDEIGFTEIRLTDTLKRAGAASDLFTKAVADGNRAWEENIALQTEAEKRYATTESQMRMAQNAIDDAGITLSEALLPVIAEGSISIKEFVENNKDGIRELGEAIAGAMQFLLDNGDKIIAVIGGISMALVGMKAASVIDTLVASFRSLKPATDAAAASQTALNAA